MDPSRVYFNPESVIALGSNSPSTLPLTGTISTHLRELAYTRMHPVEGRKANAVYAHLTRPSTAGPSTSTPTRSVGAANGANGNAHSADSKTGDFMYYSDSEEEDFYVDKDSVGDRMSCNFVDCLSARGLGIPSLSGGRLYSQRLSSEYGTRHMLTNGMMKESAIAVPQMNKIFCSKWLSDRQVVFGTKCNKLMVYDVNNHHMDQIPALQSGENSAPMESDCGIHTIEINPSRTLLATGAKNSNDVAIYRLPTLDPVCVGQGAHQDWIFDMTWIDDQFVVSGSRDGSIALWRITDEMISEVTSSELPSYLYTKPLVRKVCKAADRVRSMCFNHRRSEIVVISSNGFIHCWDGVRFKQLMSKKLPHTSENVCLTVDDDSVMYAVGSKANTDILDARTLQAIKKIPSRNNGCGIRSVSFKGNILTIGTGIGLVLFWDIRAGKFLESTMNSNRAVSLKASKGWMSDHLIHNMMDMVHNQKYYPAIYTHCYDSSGTRLFAAGGPLQFNLKGNYIALFQ